MHAKRREKEKEGLLPRGEGGERERDNSTTTHYAYVVRQRWKDEREEKEEEEKEEEAINVVNVVWSSLLFKSKIFHERIFWGPLNKLPFYREKEEPSRSISRFLPDDNHLLSQKLEFWQEIRIVPSVTRPLWGWGPWWGWTSLDLMSLQYLEVWSLILYAVCHLFCPRSDRFNIKSVVESCKS